MENKDSNVLYYHSGAISERYWYDNGELHSDDDKPSYKSYYDNPPGTLSCEQWHRKGQLHRIDNPAIIRYTYGGQVFEETWSYFGHTHREDGPAYTKYGRYYTDDDATTHRHASHKWYLMGDEITESEHIELMSLGQQLVTDRNRAILNMKHESKYIRLMCKAVLRELS